MSHRKLTVTVVVLVLAFAVWVASRTGDGDGDGDGSTSAASPTTEGDAPAEPEIVADDELYQPPSPLPDGSPGDVIQATAPEAMEGGGTRQKILYLSTTAAGDPTAVSGVLFVPDDPAPDAPVLSLAHGTIGLADCAAPSRDDTSGEPEIAYFSGLAQEGQPSGMFRQGAIVVASDFEGLGTPGVHPYVVGRSEGPNVLDAIRAARQLTGTTGDAVTIGHSQGGGAALWAAQLAPTYAPDANLVGAVSAAPAVELTRLAPVLTGSDYFAYLFMVSAGFRAAYPQLDLAAYMTPAGLDLTETLETGCEEGTFESVAGARAEDYLTADIATVEPFAGLLEENTPGDIPTDIPILLVHGEADEQLPAETSQQYLERACRAGTTTIELRTYPAANHHSVLVDARPDITTFVTDRLAGTEPTPTPCP